MYLLYSTRRSVLVRTTLNKLVDLYGDSEKV